MATVFDRDGRDPQWCRSLLSGAPRHSSGRVRRNRHRARYPVACSAWIVGRRVGEHGGGRRGGAVFRRRAGRVCLSLSGEFSARPCDGVVLVK